jgi:hypothetical protein
MGSNHLCLCSYTLSVIDYNYMQCLPEVL